MKPSKPESSASETHETSLDDVIRMYLQSLERAQPLDREQLCAEYAGLQQELEEFFSNLDRIDGLAGNVRHSWPPGSRVGARVNFGDYVALERIAQGGMGVVYRAHQKSLNRTVALKMIRGDRLCSESDVRRFQAEAKTAAALRHPAIVGVYEVGQFEGQHYFSMEYVEGSDLGQLLRERDLLAREAAEFIRQTAEAIQYAHDRGVLHRDIKPSNILVEQSGRVRITDFGLAKRLKIDSELTATGDVIGTPSYMSPEQAEGRNEQINHASDVYSLGAVLYELLTGRPPFKAHTVVATLRQAQELEPISVRTLDPSLPVDLETIVRKCLQKRPSDRYATAQALANDLARFLAGEPILARPVSPITRTWRWCRRKPVAATLIGFVVVSMVVVPLIAVHQRRLGQMANQARASAEYQAQENRRLLYAADMELALHAWRESNVGHVMQLLRRHIPSRGQEDLRGFEWYYLWRLCQQGLNTPVLAHDSNVWCVAVSPDGRLLASGDDHGIVRIWDLAQRECIQEVRGHQDYVYSIAFSPDGQAIASGDQAGVILITSINTGRSQVIRTAQGINSVAYSPHGYQLAVGGFDGQVSFWDLIQEPREAAMLSPQQGKIWSLAYSPDGQWLATSGDDGTVKLWQHPFGASRPQVLQHGKELVRCVRFSQDGMFLASSGMDRDVVLWDVPRQQRIHTLQGHTAAAESIAFAPDGRTLASAGDDRTVRHWDVRAGRQLQVLRGHSGNVNGVVFTPGGDLLVSCAGDHQVRLWHMDGTAEQSTLQAHDAMATSVSFSADGRTLVSSGWDGKLKLWNAETGALQKTVAEYGMPVRSAVLAANTDTVVATVGCDVAVISVSTGQSSILQAATKTISTVALSRDNRWLAAGGEDCVIYLWEAPFHAAPVKPLVGHKKWVWSVAFSPDNQFIASCGYDGTIRLWSTESGRQQRVLTGNGSRLTTVTFAPNGQILAAGDVEGNISLWNLRAGMRIKTLHGHYAFISACSFSPNGNTLASASYDGTVRLWNVHLGLQRAKLTGHVGRVRSVAFSPDGRTLASCGADRTVRFWRAASEAEVRAAR